jgi:predicted nucleic acid-binding protein
MRRIVLDTNVLLSFLTDRDPEQQEKAAHLFDEAAAGELTLVLHQMVVTELVYVLRNLYSVAPEVIAATIEDVLAMPGIAPENDLVWSLLLDLWPAKVSDFTDAALAAVAIQGRHDALATFDRPFARQLARQGAGVYWKLPPHRTG